VEYPNDAPQPQLPSANIAPKSLKGAKSWVEQTCEEYDRKIARWNFTKDHYTGDVLDKLDEYLIRKQQGENLEAYRERKRLADYTNHFAVVVDALAGRVFAIEDDATRRYGDENTEGLGDIEDMGSDISILARNADGRGTSLSAMLKLLATDLTQALEPWILVDGGSTGVPKVRVIPPQAVINWRCVGEDVVEAMVLDQVDTRASLRDKVGCQTQYIHYQIGRWDRYTVDDKGNVSSVGTGGVYEYYDEEGEPVLPLFRAKMPLRRMVGWLLAKKANAIFNQESSRDHLLRACNFPKLVLTANDDLYLELKQSLADGANVLQGDPEASGTHAYIAPDSGPATVAGTALQRKVDEFYATAFQMYGDASQEKTATEIRQDVASGEGAFLQLLSAALDDVENQIYWRVAQTLYPTDKKRWFVSRVTRSNEYLPIDADTALTNRVNRYFGLNAAIPVGRETLLSLVKQAADFDGLAIDNDQMEAAVDAWMLAQVMAGSQDTPALLRVRHLLKAIAATGVITEKDTVEMTDGEKKSMISEIETSATTIATAVDTSKVRDAQTFPGQ
jgi:hypothetical protein